MSEVTAKNLRDELKDLMDSQITEYSQRHYPQECVLMQERIDRFLAAFDAMAEKAELLDKAEKYLQQTLSESRLVSIARSDLRQFKVQIGKLGYPPDGYGNTLAEALKAVPSD